MKLSAKVSAFVIEGYFFRSSRAIIIISYLYNIIIILYIYMYTILTLFCIIIIILYIYMYTILLILLILLYNNICSYRNFVTTRYLVHNNEEVNNRVNRLEPDYPNIRTHQAPAWICSIFFDSRIPTLLFDISFHSSWPCLSGKIDRTIDLTD